MSEYNALINLRFNRTSGPIDLVRNIWNSKSSGAGYTIDLVDYSSAGQFSGNCATFNGETSIITKVSGNYLLLPTDQEFTISMWINTDLSEDNKCQILLSDGDIDSEVNKLYLYNSDGEVYIVLVDRDGVQFDSNDVSSTFSNNQWNYLAIVKFLDRTVEEENVYKLGIFLNGYLVSPYKTIQNTINFDKVRATIGMGLNPLANSVSFYEGKIDDVVILSNAITIENDEVAIPTDYLIIDTDEEDQTVWKEKEPEYTRYEQIVNSTELMRHSNKRNIEWMQSGLIPYRLYPAWKQVDELYFKNGEYFVNRDINSVKIIIKTIWDNHFFVDCDKYRYLDTTFEQGIKNHIFNPTILFINGKFIKWTDWNIVKSDKYVTFVINGFSYKDIVTSLQMIAIPGGAFYSERGIVPENGYKMFGFTKDGQAGGNDIIISNTNSNIIMLKYPEMQGNATKEVDIDISMKLVDSNIMIFEAGTNNEADINFNIDIGNYLTLLEDGSYDVYIFYNILHNKSGDNIANIPNEKLMREYLSMPYDKYNYDKNTMMDLSILHNDFDWSPTWNGMYSDKFYNSIEYIFNYNRSKYDKIYEDIKPVNNIEFSGEEFKTFIDDNGKVILSRDIYEKFDIKNDCYVMIFINGELPEWYNEINYTTHESIEFYPGTIEDTDVIEISFFRNVYNTIYKYNGKTSEIPLNKNYLYLLREDLLVYTDRKDYLNLCPIIYEIDELESCIRLADEKYANYGLYIGSRKQFLYNRIPVHKETQVLPIPYTFRTGYNADNYLVFLNGRLLDSAYYRIIVPKLDDNRVKTKTIYFIKKVLTTDRIDLFYISGTCDRINTSGDLVIKAIKVQAAVTNQRKFLIPLPYSNYPIDYDTFMVINKSLRMSADKYKLTSKEVVSTITRWNETLNENETVEVVHTDYYMELMDQDDYLIPGEELTFLFPYYKAEWETVDEPTSDNSLQFITRYSKVLVPTATIKFPSDYMGNIEDSRYIYVFVDTKLVDPKDYMLTDANTIVFNSNLPVNTEVAMIIETDRYNFKENNVLLNFSNIVVSEYGQTSIELPISASNKEFIFFRNELLLESNSYTVSGNKLILDRSQEDLLPGDIITAVYAIDGSTNTNTINFQSYNIKAIIKNSIDIPNFTNIRYTDTNILVFINNEFCPNVYYKVAGNTINFADNSYYDIDLYNEYYPDNQLEITSNRGSDIVNVNDEVTVFVAYKSINPNAINYDLGNKEFVRFTEEKAQVTSNDQTVFNIPYPSILSVPFRDNKFILFLRGIFIPETNYTLNDDKTVLTIINDKLSLRSGDELTFLFCHIYNFTDINKEEYTTELANGQHSFVVDSVYTTAIDLSNRILVFYGGTFVDPSRYSIDRLTRTITLKDLPGENDYNRSVTVVFLYTGLSYNGSIASLPQSGYICFNEHYIDRNYNRELYMLFVNGKKVPKSYIYDITNSIKKITVDIKTRYDLIALSTSPLITEFKKFYDDEEFLDYFNVTIEKVNNGVLEVTTGSGGVYYNNFVARYGEYFSVKYIPDKGYLPGTIFINDVIENHGNVFDNVIIRANSGEAGVFKNIIVEQKKYETIYVKCNGTTFKDNFTEIKGSTVEIYISKERIGYNIGTLHVEGMSVYYDTGKDAYVGIIGDNDIHISISNAIVDTIPFCVLDDNMYAQTLVVEFYDDNNNIINEYTNIGATIYIAYGTRMRFVLKSTDNRYKRGEYVGPFKVNNFYMVDYSYPLSNLIVEPVSPVKRFYIDIKQSANELLFVDTYPNVELIDSVQVKERHISPFYGSSNDIYSIGVEANYGYTAGNIIVSNDKLYGSIQGSFSVSITPAILDTVLFTINRSRHSPGSITAVLESGETVGVGVYIVQKNSAIIVNSKVNGIITSETFTITQDQIVTLDDVGNMIFDPEID